MYGVKDKCFKIPFNITGSQWEEKGRETKIYHCGRIYPMNVTFKETYISH